MIEIMAEGAQLRIFYAAGAGDVIGPYHYWKRGEDYPLQVSVTNSAQFYELCRELNAQAYVISYNNDRKILKDGQFILEHRPRSFSRKSGFLWHIGYISYGLGLIVSAICFKSNVVIISDGTTHWFLLGIFSWFGIKIVPSIHCTFWHHCNLPDRIRRLLLETSSYLFASASTAILVVSDEIAAQVSFISKGHPRPIVRAFPVYRREQFEGMKLPDRNSLPFRILFAGRIESNKGVFDLLEIAKNFSREKRTGFQFDLCGEGSALESLRLEAKKFKLEDVFTCHGHLDKQEMRRMYGISHIIIVPTREDFYEGFNKVVVEGILASRPVIASNICPDLTLLKTAVVEVPPGDIKGYEDAVIRLRDDSEFYDLKQKGCAALQETFYDISKGWGYKLKSILTAIG